MIAVTMVAATVAVVPAIAVLAAGFLTHVPWFGGALSWCRDAFGLHDHVPQWLGAAGRRAARRRGGSPCCGSVSSGSGRVATTQAVWRCCPARELFAYTLPGAGGHVVVSQGLLDELDDVELAIVMAHERAHGSLRHDRFVVLGAAAVALVPILAPLHRRLRFTLERWADESTVAELEVGARGRRSHTGDRGAVDGGCSGRGSRGRRDRCRRPGDCAPRTSLRWT